MDRKCTSLRAGEQVVFLTHSNIYNRKIPMDGTVKFVNIPTRTVCISWLEGYKCRDAFIPFEDILAVHNPDGEYMKFEWISGKSDLLIPE